MFIPKNYTIVDVETTGLIPKYNHIIEIACVKIQGDREVDRLQTLIKPPRKISKCITEITGITNEMVSNAPTFSEIAQDIWNFLDGEIIVAHNARFDMSFLKKNFSRVLNKDFNNDSFDTIKLCRRAYPHFESYSLENISVKLGIISQHHRALPDCLIVKSVIDKILNREVV